MLKVTLRGLLADRARPAPMAVVLALCLLAALVPETIATWSTSVAAIVANPLELLAIGAFYGPAVLLIREALVRRRLGWRGLVLLGGAFGVVNEGVVAGTWYTETPDGYAAVGQVVVAWAVALTLFHLVVSVLTPLALVDALFPSWASRPLLGRWGMILSAVVLVVMTSSRSCSYGWIAAYGGQHRPATRQDRVVPVPTFPLRERKRRRRNPRRHLTPVHVTRDGPGRVGWERTHGEPSHATLLSDCVAATRPR